MPLTLKLTLQLRLQALSVLAWQGRNLKWGADNLSELPFAELGLPKIFGEKSAKPHGGNWVKT